MTDQEPEDTGSNPPQNINEDWDLEEVHDKEIIPIIDKLIEVARKYDIPIHVTTQYACRNGENQNCTSHIPGTRSDMEFNYLSQVTIHKQNVAETMMSSIIAQVSKIGGVAVMVQGKTKEEDEDEFPVRPNKSWD